MKNTPDRAVVCYSKNEIYARLAELLQPALYLELGPAAFIAMKIDMRSWYADSDPYAEQAEAHKGNGVDPMVALLDDVLRSVGEDGDLICLVEENVYGVLRSPVTRPAEPEAFAHSVMSELAARTSAPLWGSVAVSTKGDTPGLLMTHCFHALGQAEQLGSNQLAIFDEVDRAVVQMQLAEDDPEELAGQPDEMLDDAATSASDDPTDDDDSPESLIDASKLPINKSE